MKKMFVLLSVMIISFPVSAATLKQGDSSDQVMKLQQALTDGGYFSGTVDGQFDTMTEEAVRKYQEESGVTADGVVNDIQYMNLTFESIDNPEKSASDYDYADWVQFAEGYEKAHVRELQYIRNCCLLWKMRESMDTQLTHSGRKVLRLGNPIL